MRVGALIVAGAVGFCLSILASGSRVEAQTSPKATGDQDASSKAAAAIASEAKNKNFDLSTISRAIADEASRPKNDAAGWVQKLQQLELDLNKTQQDDEAAARDLDESLVVLRAAAGRLGPDAEARATLRKEEAAVRELASSRGGTFAARDPQGSRPFPAEDRRASRCDPVGRRDADTVDHANRSA